MTVVGRARRALGHAADLGQVVGAGRLRSIEVERVSDEFAFSLASSGWHPFRSLLDQLRAAPDTPLEATDYYGFFRAPVVGAIGDLNDVLFFHITEGERPPVPRFWLGEYPWGGVDPTAGAAGTPFGRVYDEVTGYDTSALWGRGRTLWYAPDNPTTIRNEWDRTLEMGSSVARRYSPVRARGFPTVTMLVRSDGARRAVIIDGHHRLAALAHLGAPRVRVQVQAIVRDRDAPSWPAVAAGRCSPEQARSIFDAFFTLDGSERFEAVVGDREAGDG